MDFLYISLGVLAGLLIIGTLWEVFTREKAKCKYDVSVGEYHDFLGPKYISKLVYLPLVNVTLLLIEHLEG